MAEDKINSVIDEPRIKAEFDRLYDLLSKAKELVLEVNSAGKAVGSGSGVASSTAATKQAKSALSELLRIKDQLNVAESEYGQLIAKSKTLLQEQTKQNKAAAQEALGMVDAYKKLVNQYNAAQRAAKNLAVTHGLNSAAAKEAAAKAMDLGNQLKAIDASVGQYQRNVGNYASATFALSQILREAPAFAFNLQTGLLAISNNLPVLFDEFTRLSQAIDENTNKQIGAVGALGKLAKSLFSLSNLLTIGVTLITIFGKDIADWAKNLFSASSDLDKVNDLLNETFQQAGKNAGEGIAKLELYRQALTDTNIPQEERIELAKEYNEIADKGNQINIKEIDNIGKINDLIDQQIQLIKDRGLARAAENKIAESAGKLLETELRTSSILDKGDPTTPEDDIDRGALSRAKGLRLPTQDEINDPEVQKQLKDAGKSRAAILSAAAKFRQTPEYRNALKELQDAQAAFNRDVGVLNQFVDPSGLGDKGSAKEKPDNSGNEQLKALLEAQKRALEASAAQQKAILDNEKEGFDNRIAAAEAFSLIQNAIARKQQEIEVLDAGKVTNKKIEAEENYKKASVQNEIDRQENFKRIAKSSTDEEIKTILAAAENRQEAINKAEDKELERLSEFYAQGVLSRDQYEAAKLQVQNKYENESIASEIEFIRQIIELQRSRGQDTAEYEKKLNELLNKLRDENRKYEEDSRKKDLEAHKKYTDAKLDLEKQYNDKLKNLRQAAFDFALSIGNSLFEHQKNQVQDQIDQVEAQSEAEIAAVRASSDSAEQKAAREQAINLQASAQKQSLERKQRDIDSRAAQFQKYMALLQIGITTAESVFKIQAQAAIMQADPFTAPLAGLAYAQIPVVIAAGALQAAAIAAKPVPRYFAGRDGGPAEWAITGDGGKAEVIQAPDGRAWLTPNKDTLTFLPEDYKVHPSVDAYLETAGRGAFPSLPAIDGTTGSVDKLTEAVTGELKRQTSDLMQAMERNKSTMIVKNTYSGLKATAIRMNQRIEFLNREIYK